MRGRTGDIVVLASWQKHFIRVFEILKTISTYSISIIVYLFYKCRNASDKIVYRLNVHWYSESPAKKIRFIYSIEVDNTTFPLCQIERRTESQTNSQTK